MVLCIDVGNTAVKVADVEGDSIGRVTRLPTAGDPATSLLGLPLHDAVAGMRVAMVSVVPAWSRAIRGLAVERGWDLLEAGARTIPLPVALPEPGRVGADRLLGAWAARERYGAPVVLIDVGTATTIDVVDASGAFVGGAILPGPALALRALSTTALLPSVPLERPATTIGRDTVAAIQSGVVLGQAAAIGGLVRAMIGELAAPARPTVVATGGALGVLGSIEGVDRVEPTLLLRGLGALAARLAVAR